MSAAWIESAAYCNQILLVPIYVNSTLNNWLIESLGYCYHFDDDQSKSRILLNPIFRIVNPIQIQFSKWIDNPIQFIESFLLQFIS